MTEHPLVFIFRLQAALLAIMEAQAKAQWVRTCPDCNHVSMTDDDMKPKGVGIMENL